MDVLRIIFALLAVGLLGILFGLGLAVASRVLAVKKDARVTDVEGILPGANCGACGYAGCAAYAEAVVNDGADLTLCTPGGPTVAGRLGEYMGVEVEVTGEKMIAQIMCRGTRETSTTSFTYAGLEDCNALYASFQGDKDCPFGCLGMGSCIKVCPVDAIYRHEAGYIDIDQEKCISCGKCFKVCPTGVIKWVPYGSDMIVACNSTDKGGVVKKYCSVGCIGCKICEKKSPDGGFIVDNFLATIDYSKDGERESAAEACPAKCIVSIKKLAVKA